MPTTLQFRSSGSTICQRRIGNKTTAAPQLWPLLVHEVRQRWCLIGWLDFPGYRVFLRGVDINLFSQAEK